MLPNLVPRVFLSRLRERSLGTRSTAKKMKMTSRVKFSKRFCSAGCPNLRSKRPKYFKTVSGEIGTWCCHIESEQIRFLSQNPKFVKAQAFGSVAESLSSDRVWRFVMWFRMVKNTWQNVVVDQRELVSVVSIHCWGLATYFESPSNSSLESCHFPLQWSRRKRSQGCAMSPGGGGY